LAGFRGESQEHLLEKETFFAASLGAAKHGFEWA
jgi:hypothetical protein